MPIDKSPKCNDKITESEVDTTKKQNKKNNLFSCSYDRERERDR